MVRENKCCIKKDSDYNPTLTISDLKDTAVINPSRREEKINTFKQQIDSVVEENGWDLNDEDGDITKADTFDCVVYCMAGRIANNFECTACLFGIKNLSEVTTNNVELVHLKSKGYFIYLDSNLYV